jgi:hypothetical protein
MWRPAHGATTRPGPCRPASGYGRAVGRPEPVRGAPVEHDATEGRTLEPSMFGAPPAPVETEAEAPAVTP